MTSVPRSVAPASAAAAAACVAAACAAALLAACASPNLEQKAPPRVAPPAAPAAIIGDWHSLMLLPFGTLLREVPYRLDELVLFHDSASAAAGHDEHECYTLRGTAPPPLFGRPVEGYSLCFSADRLNRIEAWVSLPAESAAAEFTAACAQWQGAGTPGAAADHCQTRDAAAELDARLTRSDSSARPTVSLVLTDRTPVAGGGRE